MNAETLRSQLQRIDGRGYPAYKDIRGRYACDGFDLLIDHVQGDPFAAPSRLRVRVPLARAAFPDHALIPGVRRAALRDWLARRFARACRESESGEGSGKSGRIFMDRPGQEILDRSSVVIANDAVEARFAVGLPARGRRILGRAAIRLLCERIPGLVVSTLLYEPTAAAAMTRHLDVAEDAETLRALLLERGWSAFVAEGAILPRRSGVDDRPLEAANAVPFVAPPSLRAEADLPHAGRVAGMAIPRGIVLIVGGGYHGKSTLLSALERGIYNHVPDDGRERVVTDPTAVKIRAEDGRSVAGVDIRPFIGALPGGGDPACFHTVNASGSTSQAANIVEALEIGARTLLMDEDTCATNLMIRDARMQALVEKEGEPITPFLDRVRTLADAQGVSSILAFGGSGDYFDVADTVIRMNGFRPFDVTDQARAIALDRPTGRRIEADAAWPKNSLPRRPHPASLDPRKGRREVSIKARALRAVQYGTEEIDLSQIAQLADEAQVRAIGKAIDFARRRLIEQPNRTLRQAVDDTLAALRENGLDALDSRAVGDMAEFRAFELAAAINRLRSLRMEAV